MAGNDTLKIVFYGTTEFSIPTLDRLLTDGAEISAVVTAPDKPAGRGQKLNISPVKEFALKKNLRILQPANLKDESFINELQSIKPDLQIVVAFRMLPEIVWALPRLGTFNLHASLLPQYRGAAPINWAIINGEKETGVTTFFLRQQIDTGKIILQEKVDISDSCTEGTMHNKLKEIGADLAIKTLHLIQTKQVVSIEQEKLIRQELKSAPKLNRQNTKLDIHKSPQEIYGCLTLYSAC